MSLQRPLSLVALCSQESFVGRTVEVWTGCDFGCRYCLPFARRWARKFPVPAGVGLAGRKVAPRTCDLLNLDKLAGLSASQRRRLPPVTLSAMGDPYPALEEIQGLTAGLIALLHNYRVGARIITKSGTRPVFDFQPRPHTALAPPVDFAVDDFFEDETWNHHLPDPNLGSHPDDVFGATVTFADPDRSRRWEPRAALPEERLAGLEEAHRRGIPTMVSLTPVMDPQQALEVIRLSHGFVDQFFGGGLDREDFASLPAALRRDCPVFDWPDFAREAFSLCKRLDVPCYIEATYKVPLEVESALEAAMSALEVAMSKRPSLFTEICLGQQPQWDVMNEKRLEASLAQMCEARWGC